MSTIDADQKAEIATKYVTSNLLPNYDDATVFEMARDSSGTKIGVVAIKSGLLGTTEAYALVTLDRRGTVALAHECSKRTLYEEFGRKHRSPREDAEELADIWRTTSKFLFGERKETRTPSKCPECNAGGLLSLRSSMRRVDEGTYQCRKCGHIVRLSSENLHVHEES